MHHACRQTLWWVHHHAWATRMVVHACQEIIACCVLSSRKSCQPDRHGALVPTSLMQYTSERSPQTHCTAESISLSKIISCFFRLNHGLWHVAASTLHHTWSKLSTSYVPRQTAGTSCMMHRRDYQEVCGVNDQVLIWFWAALYHCHDEKYRKISVHPPDPDRHLPLRPYTRGWTGTKQKPKSNQHVLLRPRKNGISEGC